MASGRSFYDTYARDLRAEDVERLFTRDARDAYEYFARGIDAEALRSLPWYRRWPRHVRFFLVAFSLRLSPARRALFALSFILGTVGMLRIMAGLGPGPVVVSLMLAYLLIMLEVADRVSLKGDLEVAREIQQAMLPNETFRLPAVAARGFTRPANTVGGDFYDILPLPDGRIVVALGDVAGKGSPAALLMALLLAMLRTLVDEGLEAEALIERLNGQICRHSPPSRFITLFYGVFDPAVGSLTYVNAGQNPPLLRRASGAYERLDSTGVALGMFERSTYTSRTTVIAPSELLVLYSDGITEAEDKKGQPFDEAGLQKTLDEGPHDDPAALGAAVLAAVERHARESRLADDLTVLVLRRAEQPVA
jgi:serine phosphatase RsbU (regulator of sigma subunit)